MENVPWDFLTRGADWRNGAVETENKKQKAQSLRQPMWILLAPGKAITL